MIVSMYTDDLDPWDITENESGFVCYGVWDADPALWEGYVGRCWDPGGACSKGVHKIQA